MPYLEADAGELSQALGKFGLHSEFQTSLVYGEDPNSQNKSKTSRLGFELMLDLIPSPGKLLRCRTSTSNEEPEKLHRRLYCRLHFPWAAGRLDVSHGATKTTPFFPTLHNKSYGYILVAMIFMRIEFCLLTCSSHFKKHINCLHVYALCFHIVISWGKLLHRKNTHTSSVSLLWFIYSYISPPSVGLTESIWGWHRLLLKELSLPVLFHQELLAKTNAGFIDSPWVEGWLTVAIPLRPLSIWRIPWRCFTLLKHADFVKTTQGFTSSAWFLCF